VIAPGHYQPDIGAEFVRRYAGHVERELARRLAPQSIAYWLHVYRRIAPTYPEAKPKTVGIIRATVEAAVQKYAQFGLCNRIGRSNETAPESILGGDLARPEFAPLLAGVQRNPQLVLTDFGLDELRECYEIEALGFEMWRCGATLRILGKGAPLVVTGAPPYFHDDRTDDLHRLVTSYDERHLGGFGASATGVVIPVGKPGTLLPFYNVDRERASTFASFFAAVSGWEPPSEFEFNFLWTPFDLRGYYEAHRPFEAAFVDAHGTSLGSVLCVIGAVCLHAFLSWRHAGPGSMVRYWQRAYESTAIDGGLMEDIRAFMPAVRRALGHDGSDSDIQSAIGFLTLDCKKQEQVDVMLAGPHRPFLPWDTRHVFFDYAWIFGLLNRLFFGLKLGDQNFKGDALERLVRVDACTLPSTPCIGGDGEKKQVDAAFAAGDRLVIIECRAFAQSLGFERGDPTAIAYRSKRIDQALTDVDAKAKWLAQRPVGRNYDISRFKFIVPIAVTPFIEFIPSTASRYWLNDSVPRVLTPDEVGEARRAGVFESGLRNLVAVQCMPPDAMPSTHGS